ncbi:MAG: 3-hydroxyacyl-CoA dehydrogenase NAD-binding domain-containing protein [Paracoccaceae bacterium]
MITKIDLEYHENIAIITICNPPVNALNIAVRKGLLDALKKAEKKINVRAIILKGSGKTFPAGADIKEFGLPPQSPDLPIINDYIENINKPVICVLHGNTLGGGLEIALACHYRIAHSKTKLGLPEVHLGLIPGAGGTQRLPRLIGISEAYKMMVNGLPINAVKALKLGLINKIIEEIDKDSIKFANNLIANNEKLERTKDKNKLINNLNKEQETISELKNHFDTKYRGQIAPQKIFNCLEKLLKSSFEEGQKFERNTFFELLKTDQSKSLIHAFFAERKSSKIPEIQSNEPRNINTIGIVGGGTMGSRITIAALNAGIPVTMVERDKNSLEEGIKNVEKIYKRDIEKGRLSSSQVDEIFSRFTKTTDFEALSSVDMVIEAVFEDMTVKKQVFKILDKVIKKGGILASNTSYLDINQLAAMTSRPEDVIGLHFFSPANIMRLLEIVIPDKVSNDVVATGFYLAKKMKKIPVRAGICDGFIGNRILDKYSDCAFQMMEDGVTPYEIDKAIYDFGYPMGPFQMFDLAGGDIGWAKRKRQAKFRDSNSRYVNIPDKICEKGWFGQKSGRGFYRYDKGNTKGDKDPEVLEIIEREIQNKGIIKRKFTQEEIIRRYMAAMINESANVLYDKIALRPSDIDITKINGYGFPRYKGGPMKYADNYGLDNILNDLKAFGLEQSNFWKPSPLIIELVKKGNNFNSLNK